MLNKTIFGPLLNVNMVFNGQLIHHFLLRQIPKEVNTDGICFSVLEKNVCFTQKEFNIITGLWPTNVTLEKDYDNKRLQSLLFGSENKKIIICLEVEEIFKNFEFTNDHDAVKVALAVFIETVMIGKDKKHSLIWIFWEELMMKRFLRTLIGQLSSTLVCSIV
ncbi:hypothetical protein IC582_020012 [Cucumis melo]